MKYFGFPSLLFVVTYIWIAITNPHTNVSHAIFSVTRKVEVLLFIVIFPHSFDMHLQERRFLWREYSIPLAEDFLNKLHYSVRIF